MNESLSYLSQSNKRPRPIILCYCILCYFFKLSLWPRGVNLRLRNEINVLRVWNSFENSFGISLRELLWEERRKNGRKNWYSWKRKDEALTPLKWEVKRRKKRFKNVNALKIISQITNTNYLPSPRASQSLTQYSIKLEIQFSSWPASSPNANVTPWGSFSRGRCLGVASLDLVTWALKN